MSMRSPQPTATPMAPFAAPRSSATPMVPESPETETPISSAHATERASTHHHDGSSTASRSPATSTVGITNHTSPAEQLCLTLGRERGRVVAVIVPIGRQRQHCPQVSTARLGIYAGRAGHQKVSDTPTITAFPTALAGISTAHQRPSSHHPTPITETQQRSHRRGHWFEPSIAHPTWPQVSVREPTLRPDLRPHSGVQTPLARAIARDGP